MIQYLLTKSKCSQYIEITVIHIILILFIINLTTERFRDLHDETCMQELTHQNNRKRHRF